MRNAGFSLLELLVVVAIIGVLSAYVAPRYFSNVEKSQIQAARSQISALKTALSAYRLDVGQFPDTTPGLSALMTPGPNANRWRGPYLDGELPLDPWGSPYVSKSVKNANMLTKNANGPICSRRHYIALAVIDFNMFSVIRSVLV